LTVRKATGTTVSLLILIIGIAYLFPIVRNALPYRVLYTLYERIYSQYTLGGIYPFFVKFAVSIIVLVGILDAILRNKTALGLLSSLNIPIVMSIPVIITALIQKANMYMFWAILQIAVIIGVYWTFRKIIRNNRPSGQKLIQFIKGLKSGGGEHNGHASDHCIVLGACLLLLIVYASVIISFILFVANHWSMFT